MSYPRLLAGRGEWETAEALPLTWPLDKTSKTFIQFHLLPSPPTRCLCGWYQASELMFSFSEIDESTVGRQKSVLNPSWPTPPHPTLLNKALKKITFYIPRFWTIQELQEEGWRRNWCQWIRQILLNLDDKEMPTVVKPIGIRDKGLQIIISQVLNWWDLGCLYGSGSTIVLL